MQGRNLENDFHQYSSPIFKQKMKELELDVPEPEHKGSDSPGSLKYRM